MWTWLACHHPAPPPPALPRTEPAALVHYVTGRVAAERDDVETTLRSARWVLLLDPSPWAGVHATELMVTVGAVPDEAVNHTLDRVDRWPACDVAAALDALAALVPDDARVTDARAGLCP